MSFHIDAHNHLQDASLAAHRAEVVAVLERIGIARSVVNGTRESDWESVAALAREHAWVLPSYGLHPWFLAQRTPHWRERLVGRVEQGDCAIGEIGLDRWIKGFDFDDQREVFVWQFALAAERNLPVTIHCLKAWGALAELLRAQPAPARGFLLHAYGGPGGMVAELADRGAYFSFNGYFLHPRKAEQREVFRHIPADRLLVETDAPAMPLPPERAAFMLPDSAEGKPVNHPGNIVAAYEALAGLRGVKVDQLAVQVRENFTRLFGA